MIPTSKLNGEFRDGGVQGYSRMMGEDEVGTFHTLSSYLEIILSTKLEGEVNAIIITNGAQTGR